jgi:hypothetical protein
MFFFGFGLRLLVRLLSELACVEFLLSAQDQKKGTPPPGWATLPPSGIHVNWIEIRPIITIIIISPTTTGHEDS